MTQQSELLTNTTASGFVLDRLPSQSTQRAMRAAAAYQKMTGLTMALLDTQTGLLTDSPLCDMIAAIPESLLRDIQPLTEPHVFRLRNAITAFALPVPGDVQGLHAVIGWLNSSDLSETDALKQAALDAGWSLSDWNSWEAEHSGISQPHLRRLLNLAAKALRQDLSLTRAIDEADSLAEQINALYEQVGLMHGLTSQLRVSTDPTQLVQNWIGQLRQTLRAKGCGVWLQDGGRDPVWLESGVMSVDAAGLSTLLARFDAHDWTRPFVKNLERGKSLSPDIPHLRNLIVTPLNCSNRKAGWLIAENAEPGKSFGSVEASLMTSVATVLATHLQNVALFRENEDLVRSFVESLVCTIDAKDPYTHGHSLRVARIARALAKELGLSDSQQQDIYLSGLVHDIGKVGVDDSILQKPGRLTETEFRQIQKHPQIGAEILSGVPNLSSVIPGVLHHHEAFDGTGYPEGLVGSRIPRIARILAVADAYDAMLSDRPYREGLPPAKVLSILTDGAGEQWDPAVVQAMLSIESQL